LEDFPQNPYSVRLFCKKSVTVLKPSPRPGDGQMQLAVSLLGYTASLVQKHLHEAGTPKNAPWVSGKHWFLVKETSLNHFIIRLTPCPVEPSQEERYYLK
jgi:hypothetical protein